jgi:DEAD/DEAH box helicase domain-containing protein
MVNIRGVAEDMYTVVDTTNGKSLVLEEIEASRASFEIYEGTSVRCWAPQVRDD